jgi:hypothetical protein
MFVGKLLDYAIAALAGATAVQSKELLSGQHFLLVTLAPPLLAVLTFVVLNQIHRAMFRNSRRIRQFFDPLAEFEGLWLDSAQHNGDTHYGIVELKYNKSDDCHYVFGQSFLKNGHRTATWHSEPLYFDAKKLTIEYRWEGRERVWRNTRWHGTKIAYTRMDASRGRYHNEKRHDWIIYRLSPCAKQERLETSAPREKRDDR